MTIIFKDPEHAGKTGTHVLLVGASEYPHFPERTPTNSKGRLTSAELGAKAMAKWFLTDFYNPEKPLISMRALFSNPDVDFCIPSGTSILPPTWGNFKAAYDEWFEEATNVPGSTLVFYFGGHGIASATFQALLLDDFHQDPNNSMEGAVDFNNLKITVGAKSGANDVWYFIDTCRYSNARQAAGQSTGRLVYANYFDLEPGAYETDIRSTVLGGSAGGFANSPSFFASALIAALKNNAFDKQQNEWRANATAISTAVQAQLDKIYREANLTPKYVQRPQFTLANNKIIFHRLRHGLTPQMQVSLTCKNASHNATHDLFWAIKRTAPKLRTERNTATWEFSLPAADHKYQFGAIDDSNASHGVIKETINKPNSEILLDIGP